MIYPAYARLIVNSTRQSRNEPLGNNNELFSAHYESWRRVE